MALKPLSLKRGTSSTITVTIPDALEPAGATVYFTVKPSEVTQSLQDSDNLAIFKKTITERTGRTFTKDIDPDDTKNATPGRYVYGITVKLANGEIYGTSAEGKFIIKPRDTADTESGA